MAEGSVEFQQLIHRLAKPDPVDTWQADMRHYFLYELEAEADGQPPHALFITNWEYDAPVSVVVFTPDEAMKLAQPSPG